MRNEIEKLRYLFKLCPLRQYYTSLQLLVMFNFVLNCGINIEISREI